MILMGLAFLVIGIATVVFAQNIWNFTGGIDFVENHLPGDTKAFIQFVGVITILLGMLFITGLGGWLTGPIGESVGRLFGISQQ